MEKNIFEAQDGWTSFQKYPTNSLQMIMDYVQVILKGASSSDVVQIIDAHKKILDSGVTLEKLYGETGMAGNSTIQR